LSLNFKNVTVEASKNDRPTYNQTKFVVLNVQTRPKEPKKESKQPK